MRRRFRRLSNAECKLSYSWELECFILDVGLERTDLSHPILRLDDLIENPRSAQKIRGHFSPKSALVLSANSTGRK